MIITPDFVYVHYPKTGGSFVTSMVVPLYSPPRARPDVLRRGVRRAVRRGWPRRPGALAERSLRLLGHLDVDKHGGCAQIPPGFADRPIVSTVRLPYDRYVSMFDFPLWRSEQPPYLQRRQLAERLPRFPDVTFETFLRVVSDHRGPWCAPAPAAERLGFETRDFIFHFCREPGRTVERILRADPADAAQLVREDLHEVTFLRTERLNEDLADFLRRFGHGEEVLGPIRAAGKVWPLEGGRDADASWRPSYTEELLAHVRAKDHVLFELFPEYDVEGVGSVEDPR